MFVGLNVGLFALTRLGERASLYGGSNRRGLWMGPARRSESISILLCRLFGRQQKSSESRARKTVPTAKFGANLRFSETIASMPEQSQIESAREI